LKEPSRELWEHSRTNTNKVKLQRREPLFN
jgi:hypothetical protein